VPRLDALTISAAFIRAAARVPDRVAVRSGDREVTYAQLDRDSRQLASALLSTGSCRAGDRVGLLLGNTAEFLVAVLSVARAGLVAVPIPTEAPGRDLVQFVDDSQMRRLLVSDAAAERLGDELEQLSAAGLAINARAVSVAGAKSVEQLIAGMPAGAIDLAREDAPFFFGYTSGTTGRPKAAVVTHRARTLLALAHAAEYGCYVPGEVHLITTPMYHGAGLSRALAPLLTGAAIELHERFDRERLLDAFAGDSVTATFMVPTMFAAVFDLPDAALERQRGAIRTILSNASALPEHLKHRILAQWPGVRLFEIYGSTEAGTVTSLRPEDQLRKQRCVGLPLPLTDVRLLDDDGAEVADGDTGQLFSASPYLFSGYHNNNAATDAVTRDGYVTSGDLARRDDEGFVYIVGRVSDVIISGGVNVYPREVEELLAEHPAVREAAVFSVPDVRWGEAVHAVVVPDRRVPIPRVEQLLEHCRRGLAPEKIPKQFSFRESLPRTGTGKVATQVLRDDLGAATRADDR
jgi:long-chain acyl-CoA synthetase